MGFEKQREELRRLREHALQMGGPEKVRRQHEAGRLTARERIERLLDPGTFLEMGMLNHSDMPGMEDKSPADSKVVGFGKVDGRQVAIEANDFTTLAASSSRVAGRKEKTHFVYAVKRGLPIIFFGEAGGARMPDIMGSIGMTAQNFSIDLYNRNRQVPLIAGVMGQSYGLPTWMACLADFVVQVKGSSMAVSGPRVLELAISQKVSEEELGGWEVHASITGMTDSVAEDEEHCFQLIRKFLDYLPSNNQELPPVRLVPRGSGQNMDRILDFVPEQRNRGYDMYNVIRTMVDGGEVFPVKELFGRTVITCLARMGGHTVGFIANQPFFMGGAMDADGIDKVISFIVLCDSFNIPLIFLHDIPGFFVGKDAERQRVAAKIINWMVALAQITVPKISIIIRKTYGMAFFNMCGTGCGADFLVAWPSADISFMDPDVGVNVVYGAQFRGGENVKEERQKFLEKWGYECSPYPAAGLHYLDDVIDPPETRDYIIRCLELARGGANGGISEHRLANWPTKF